jgi:hypothetical protein
MPLTDKTRKILWGSSGNRCAVCRRELLISSTPVDAESIVGEECHIISGKLRGPRYDATCPVEKIDTFENLILLCAVHHKMIDDQPETYTTELLRTLKGNHGKWVRAALADEKKVQPVNLRRVKENIPSHLVRLKSGRDVLKIVGDAYAFQFDHPDPIDEEEAQLLASFLQDAQDWGDLSSELEAGARVNAAFDMTERLGQLEGAGFWVFGGREIQHLEGGISGGPSDWPVAILEIYRTTDPEILKEDLTGGEK